MPSSFGGLQFKITAAILTAFVLLAAMNEFLRTSVSSLVATAVNLTVTLVVFILIFWYIRRQTRPLEELAETARKITAGELAARASQDLKNEIGALAEAFNSMADQLTSKINLLEEDNQVKKEFISIMAHNLQTPLTLVRGYLDELREEKEPVTPNQADILEKIEKTVKGLGETNSRFLTTVELQGELVKLNKVKKDLAPLAGLVVREFEERAEEKKITLDFNAAREPLIAEFDEEWIKVVLENLMDNALKFTPKKGMVTVGVGKAPEGDIFGEVKDTGIGVPESKQEKVMLPFQRVHGVMSADYEGVGLGLYIAKLVIEKHGGRLELESQKDEGTRIRFVLPKPKD